MADKSQYLETKAHTEAEKLDQLLNQLENNLSKIKFEMDIDAASILRQFDEAYAALGSLKNRGLAQPAAEEHFEMLSSRLKREAGRMLARLGGSAGLERLRKERQPEAEAWWWYPDRLVADRRKANLRRAGLYTLILAALAVVAGLLYQRFLKPDPQLMQRIEAKQSAETFAQQGDLDQALVEVDKGLELAPDDPELLLLRGTILAARGQNEEAENLFRQVEQLVANEESFRLLRGQQYLTIGQPEPALADAEAVIGLNPKSADGYILQGFALEALNRPQEAYQAYQTASDLANESGASQLVVLARMRMGMLRQNPAIIGTPAP
jgi:Tfp pilus assembly protein PilF